MPRPNIPVEIIVEITGKCKLVCEYCTDSRRPHVPLGTVLQLLDEAAAMGVKGVRITGGEPLLHPDIEAILEHARAKKFRVTLNTTAEEIDPSLMRSIIRNVDIGLISLQGYSLRTNAAYTRSRASFEEKIKNIFFLRTQLKAILLATVLTPRITASFHKFLPLIENLRPDSWVLLRPISDPNDDHRLMDVNFYRTLTLKILKARKEGINVYIGNPLPLCIMGDLFIGKQAFLGATADDGHNRLVFSAEGFYKPSYFISTNLGRTLQEAWEHPFLKELSRTDTLPEACQRCPLLKDCQGGSRAMSLRTFGSILSPDPLFDSITAEQALKKYSLKHPTRKTSL